MLWKTSLDCIKMLKVRVKAMKVGMKDINIFRSVLVTLKAMWMYSPNIWIRPKRQVRLIWNLGTINLIDEWKNKTLHIGTLYNVILRIAWNMLETRKNIKILTHPFYNINLGWFSWEWSKKKEKKNFEKKNSKWPTQKKLLFQNRQFSKFFRENFTDSSLG